MKIGFIGAGKMAEALISGMLAKGVCRPGDVVVSDRDPGRCSVMRDTYAVEGLADNGDVVRRCDVVVLAVKPQDLDVVLAAVAGEAAGRLFVSIAAGKPLSFFETRLSGARVVRVMPNLACQVGQGMSVYCTGDAATAADVEWVRQMLASCGQVVAQDERMFDVVTALSGSGPAFFAYVLKAFVEAAVGRGMAPETALMLGLQTMRGTAVALQEGGQSPEAFISSVASKGGTTAAGLAVLDASDVYAVLQSTLVAAAERSAALRA